ncbi:hypothetical protein [Magnetospirillum sp. UT-4]|uniref:hypothetical protein n=1 Tax=Magnetospirillum sp. UT-4 TaxID=2681467 RepID=UPI001383FBF9|nr:hypothetical protein [Magnetospirillum sp. UT-4]CAA7623606.1 conserved hypothetical protein [Magnetospirillum sp. UT-4]
MPTIYVATSKANQDWASDVGLGKNVYKVGIVEDGTPEDVLEGFAGQGDWKVLATEPTDLAEDDALARLARKEKAVDPTYYPKLRGATGLFKVNLTVVENSLLVALALEGRDPPKNFKLKPKDVAAYLINNAVK